jgi:hypothetical protein
VQPGAFCSEEFLKIMQDRISTLSKLGDICLDLGIPYVLVPTMQELKDAYKEEFFMYGMLSMVPHTKAEYEAAYVSALDSHAIHSEFFPGEQPGPEDKSRLELYDRERDEFILNMEQDALPQYSLGRFNDDGSPKETCTFSGMRANTGQKLRGMQNVYFSGPRFRVNPHDPSGKEDSDEDFTQAVKADMDKYFVSTKSIPKININLVHDVTLAQCCKEAFYDKLRDLHNYQKVLNPERGRIPMTHEVVSRDPAHPGRLVPIHHKDSSVTNKQGAAHVSISRSPFSATTPAAKAEKAYDELRAKALGENPRSPRFWRPTVQDGNLISRIPLQNRRAIINNLIADGREEEERASRFPQHDERSMNEHLDLEIEDLYDCQETYSAPKQSEQHYASGFAPVSAHLLQGEDDTVHMSSTFGDRREYYEDARDRVMEELAGLNAVQLKSLPLPIRERVADYRDHRSATGGREEHRHDGPQWQERRNSAGHNSGRIYDAPKSVTFANSSTKKTACYKHLRNQCPHADDPTRCQWSHDDAICAAEADVISTVARDRKTKSQATTRQTDKLATVAAMAGANTSRQQMNEYSNDSPRYARPFADTSQEE